MIELFELFGVFVIVFLILSVWWVIYENNRFP